MSKTQKSPAEIAAYYAEIERRHPEQRHTLGDRPQPPLQLLRCRRCAASPRAVFTRYAYGLPAYKVQCEQCGSQIKPQMWGVGKMFAEIPHTVTEAEALADACELWNASQKRAAIIADIMRMYEQLDDKNKALFRIAVYAAHDKEEREQQAKDGERE